MLNFRLEIIVLCLLVNNGTRASEVVRKYLLLDELSEL